MKLHLHCGRWQPIVFSPSGALSSRQKGCIIRSSMWPDANINLSSVVPQVCQWKLALKNFPWGPP